MAQVPEPLAPEDPYLAILDGARSAPVEIFADVTFRLLDKLPAKQKAVALEEVFRRAGEARELLPLRYALAGPPPEPFQVLDRAHNLRLDALSLRCRAVQALLTIDPRLARELFEQMPQPEVPRTDCGSAFVADAGVYARTLAAVAGRGAFTPQERRKEAPWLLVERGARGVSSSWEIVAAAAELPRFARNEKEAGILTAALAGSLSLWDSDRGFTSAIESGDLVKAIIKAGNELKPDGADLALLAALRGYLVRHLAGARCEDSVISVGLDSFQEAIPGRDIRPISPDERKPAKLEGKAARPGYATDAAFSALSGEVDALGRVSPGQSLWKVRLTSEWGFRARQALSNIEDWKGSPGQGAVEIFHQKCRLLARVIDVAPAGETYRIAQKELIFLMEDPAILNGAPAEWLLEVEWLLMMQNIFTPERVQIMRNVLGPGANADSFVHETGLEVPHALAASRLPALSLYGRLGLLRAGRASK